MLTVTMASLALGSSLRDMLGGVYKLWYARMLRRRVHGLVWFGLVWGVVRVVVVWLGERKVGRDCWGERKKREKFFLSGWREAGGIGATK